MLKKILVVDDSDLLHRMYDLVLSRYRQKGATVLHATNGQEALSQLAIHLDTDLVILDINMPVMSGLEFLQHCRRENLFHDIVVIVISTEGGEEDTLAALRSGAAGYLTKPFVLNALHDLIERVLAANAQRQQQATAGV